MRMRLLELEFKNSIRKIYPVVVVAGVCAYLYCYHFILYHTYHANDLDSIMMTQRIAFVVFIASAILSLDLFLDLKRKDNRDLLYTIAGFFNPAIVMRFFLSLLVVLIFFINAILIDFILVWPAMNMPVFVFRNVLISLCMNYLLFPVIGIAVGFFCGACLRRWKGLMLFLVTDLCAVGMFQSLNIILFRVYEGRINLDVPSRLLTLIQPNADWYVDPLFLIPVESYRIYLYIGWGLFFVTMSMVVLLAGKKRFFALVPCVLCILSFLQVVNAGCVNNLNSNAGNAAMDMVDFREETPVSKQADYHITGYTINLSINKDLVAVADVAVEGGGNTYCFTLYRGYRISTIEDDKGNLMKYDRNLDYITVYDTGETAYLRFFYRGYSGTFMSNRTAVVLPGFFAWYPQPGFRPVYLHNVQDAIESYGYNQNISMFEETNFQIKLNYGGQNISSNLLKEEEGFVGKAKSATLIGGALEERKEDGIDLVYPILMDIPRDYLERYQNMLTIYERELQISDLNLPQKLIFLTDMYAMADTSESGFFGLDGYILTTKTNDPEGLAEDTVYGIVQTGGTTDVLWRCVLEQIAGRGTGGVMSREAYLNWEAESAVPDWPIEDMYATLISNWDEEDVNRRIFQWLRSEDKTDCIIFLKSLYLELENS